MTTHWTLAHRAAKMNPSVMREIPKITERLAPTASAGALDQSLP